MLDGVDPDNGNQHLDISCKDSPGSVQLRQRFRTFLADDDLFRKFVDFCNHKCRQKKRLMTWQEELWKRFTHTHREYENLSIGGILFVFHICHVHFTSLFSDSVPIKKGVCDIHYFRDFEKAVISEAPYSTPFLLDSPSRDGASFISVDHCKECLARRAQLEERY